MTSPRGGEIVWLPVKDAGLQKAITASLASITDELVRMPMTGIHPYKLCERALIYAYLTLEHSNDEWEDRSLDCLNAAIETFASSSSVSNGLYGGLAGTGWIIQHISSLLSADEGHASISNEEEDVLSEVDERLLEHLLHLGPSLHNYDLINGVVGIGVYWLERLPRKRAVEGIMQSLAFLKHISQSMDGGLTWFTPPPLIHSVQKELAPKGFYNLGVAHGTPGIIGFLAQAASIREHEEISEPASKLLIASVDWLLSQRHPLGSPSRYSNWYFPNQDSGPSRLGWCYGDLGIAAMLHQAGIHARQETWNAEALALAQECASRKLDTHVLDATLCHGAFGVAHIFNRFYNFTLDENFLDTAMYWIHKGLAFRRENTGPGDYYAWDPAFDNCLRSDASFLSGSAGIALFLLSCNSSFEPAWDRLLLLSGR